MLGWLEAVGPMTDRVQSSYVDALDMANLPGNTVMSPSWLWLQGMMAWISPGDCCVRRRSI